MMVRFLQILTSNQGIMPSPKLLLVLPPDLVQIKKKVKPRQWDAAAAFLTIFLLLLKIHHNVERKKAIVMENNICS
jgi:hypothetical protein